MADKAVYLLVLMLISVNFFHFTPIARLTTNDISLVLFFLWMLVGFFLYKPKDKLLTIRIKYWYWPVLAVWGGVFISFFASWALYGQGIITSMVTSRRMLSLLALPLLGVVIPSIKDIMRAVVWFSLILLAFAILDAIGVPILDGSFYMDENKPWMQLIDEDSFVICLPGFHWVAMALFFYLHKLRKSLTAKNLLGSLFFMGAVFLLQNRSMLFASALIFAFTFVSLKTSNKYYTVLIRTFSLVLIAGIIILSMPQWIKLVTETTTQLGSDDYNRILAYNYFLFEACPSFIYYLTGVGYISTNVSSLVPDLMASGIYNSDVGFIGFWNYYGIIPIIGFFVLIYLALKKNTPFYLKANALVILVGSISIACFNTMDKLLWLSMFVYFIHYRPRRVNAQPEALQQ